MPFVQESMKNLNRETVFEIVTEQGEITRTDLAEMTRSSMPTILKITNFLLEQNIISLAGSEVTARGRRPQVYHFEPDSILGIGISCDGKKVVVSLVNYYGEEKQCLHEDCSLSFDKLLDTVVPGMIDTLLSGVNRKRVKGAGISVNGAVNTEKELEIFLGGYSELRIEESPEKTVKRFSERIGLPVYVFNDVNAAVVGEYVLRKMKKEDLLYIYIGQGIGAGLILDGELRVGRHFYTGEIAHMVFDADHRLDRDKPGWMESRMSASAIDSSGNYLPQQVKYTASNVGLIIANICNVLDVENVVIGGETVDAFGEDLQAQAAQYLDHLLLFPVKLSRAASGRSEIIGSAYMAMRNQINRFLADDE